MFAERAKSWDEHGKRKGVQGKGASGAPDESVFVYTKTHLATRSFSIYPLAPVSPIPLRCCFLLVYFTPYSVRNIRNLPCHLVHTVARCFIVCFARAGVPKFIFWRAARGARVALRQWAADDVTRARMTIGPEGVGALLVARWRGRPTGRIG